MEKETLMKIKKYLENISYINHIVGPELLAQWDEAYDSIYFAINGVHEGQSNESR